MRLLLALIAITIFMWILSLFGFNTKIIIEATLLAMTPLALAAIGESLNEKAGTVNIGLEGIFLISALTGVYVAELAGNGVVGLLGGTLVGAFIGFIFGLLSVYGRGDQIIAGMGINIFALGFVPYSLMAFWGTPGIRIPPREVLVQPIDTPATSRASGISPAAFIQSPIFVL
jgi:simple sugar transport system permease protein